MLRDCLGKKRPKTRLSSPRRRWASLRRARGQLPYYVLFRLGKLEKSYCKLLGDFCGLIVADFVAQFVKCPWYAQSMV